METIFVYKVSKLHLHFNSQMIAILKTNSENLDFINLVALLDAELAVRDGADHDFYNQFNTIATLQFCIVAYKDKIPVGCGAIREYSENCMEIKRMFVPFENRGKGIASKILTDLEIWASDLGFSKCILETGINQPEALSLYKKMNYNIIPNYGQYENVATSICFEKKLL